MNNDTPTQQVHSAVNEGWMQGGSFFGSVVAGILVGFLADRWLGTAPWLVVIGIVVGSYAGFMNLWHYSKRMEEPRGR